MYPQILFFQVKIVVHIIVLGVKISCYFICFSQENSPLVLIILEQHGECKHLQQHEADKSKITADKKEYVTHLQLKHKVLIQDTRHGYWVITKQCLEPCVLYLQKNVIS